MTDDDPTNSQGSSVGQDVPEEMPLGDGHRLAQQAAEQAKEDNDAAEAGGAVSQAENLDPAASSTPISDGQSVAGQPDGESGEVQEGKQGPNANPHQDRPTH